MWSHPATRENVDTLRRRGVELIGPERGEMAEGEVGVGRMTEPEEIFERCALLLEKRGQLRGRRVLVTAGGTREPLDAVRFLGNRSSGRMGFALAEAAARRGARVTALAANVSLPRRPGIDYTDVTTAAELHDAATAAFAQADVLLMAAAVADFRPGEPAVDKIKKAGRDRLSIELEPTTDVLAALAGARREGQTVVGFAAEHGPDAVAGAREKLTRKGLDAIVLNDVSDSRIGFDSPDNEVIVVTATEAHHVPRAPKDDVAGAILDMLLSDRSSPKVKVPR
jgi:phosphopantothenoylcysteine decarboxylase / phosphopantothenate---cysteine ligase